MTRNDTPPFCPLCGADRPATNIACTHCLDGPREIAWVRSHTDDRINGVVGGIIMWIFAGFLMLAIAGLSFGLSHPSWFGILWCGVWILLFTAITGILLWAGFDSMRKGIVEKRWRFTIGSDAVESRMFFQGNGAWTGSGFKWSKSEVKIDPQWAQLPLADSVYRRIGGWDPQRTASFATSYETQPTPTVALAVALLRLSARGCIVLTRHQPMTWARRPEWALGTDSKPWFSARLSVALLDGASPLERSLLEALSRIEKQKMVDCHPDEVHADGAYRAAAHESPLVSYISIQSLAGGIGRSQEDTIEHSIIELRNIVDESTMAVLEEQAASIDWTALELDQPQVISLLQSCWLIANEFDELT